MASLAFDVEPFDACVHHEGKWCDIGDTLYQVVADSLCGKQAFGCQYKSVEGETMEKMVKASNAKLLKLPC